ncbi:MAG TPA: deaminase, partial [Acidimicrobiia bacterium]
MDRAITIAERVRRRTPPNPWVGCVLVRDGQVVGEGATFPPGGAHAEAAALTAAGEQARGATAYVTLEPCAHQGRTEPCTTALIDAGT